jgi:hypothetical protein
MTSHDSDDDALPAEEAGNAEKKPPDLRFSKIEQGGVTVNRDLSGQGHLARGSHTNMSNMRFSVRAQPRSELDPELQALRPVEAEAHRPRAEEQSVTPDEVPPQAIDSEPVPDGGILASIKRLFT